MNEEALYGVHPVKEALAAGRRRVFCVYAAKSRTGKAVDEIIAMARKQGVPVEPLETGIVRDQGANHQGVAALVSPFSASELEDVLATGPKPGKTPFFLVLDGIEDPRNLGALIRTALCAGVDAVISPERNCAPLTPSVSKASSGALEHSTVCRVKNLVRALSQLKDAGFWIFGADAGAGFDFWDCDFSVPTALVVGGEGRGIRPLVARECDQLVKIPQSGPLGSLNASVAGALLMYEVVRQRQLSS